MKKIDAPVVDGLPPNHKDCQAQALKGLFEKAGIKMSTRTGVKVNEAGRNIKSECTLIPVLLRRVIHDK